MSNIITELRDPVYIHVDGRGKGWCHWLIHTGAHCDIIWGTILNNGEVWWAANAEVRVEPNWTMGRGKKETKPHPNVVAAKPKRKTKKKSKRTKKKK